MGGKKRSRKKRKKPKPRENRSGTSRHEESPGISVDWFRSRPETDEEHRAKLNDLVSSIPNLRESLERNAETLLSLVRPYHPVEALAQYAIRTSLSTWAVGADSRETSAQTEYLGGLLLTKPTSYFAPENESRLPPEVLQEIADLVQNQFVLSSAMFMAKEIDPDRNAVRGDKHDVRIQQLLHSLFHRNSGYAVHHKEVLLGLLEPLDAILLEVLGFVITEALSLVDEIVERAECGLAARVAEARAENKLISRLVKRIRQRGRLRPGDREGIDRDMLDALASRAPSESRLEIQRIAASRVPAVGRELLQFGAEEIAEAAGVDPIRAQAFFDCHSIGFGEADPDLFRLPSPTPPLLSRFFIRDAETYFCPILERIPWCLQESVEGLLKARLPNSDRRWKRYEKARANFLEVESLRVLSDSFPKARTFHSLNYVPEADIKKSKAELDGLVLIDDLVFMLEGKSGGYSTAARRAAPDRMRRDVGAIVGDAWDQLARAMRYYDGADSPTFRAKDGAEVVIDKSQVSYVIPIAVSLQALDIFQADASTTQIITRTGSPIPWSVSLASLRVVADLSPRAFVLSHYALNRRSVDANTSAKSADELDWFGMYLNHGLAPIKEETNFLAVVTGFTDDIDAYYQSPGRHAVKPKLIVDPIVDSFLKTLSSKDAPLCSPFAHTLLDIPRDQMKTVGAKLRARATSVKGKKDWRYVSLLNARGSTASTFFVIHPGDLSNAVQRAEVYGRALRYRQRHSSWFGFVMTAPGLKPVSVLQDHGEWEFDEGLERAAAVLFDGTRGLPDLVEARDEET